VKLAYRPEIDGLRAIAVGAVVLYHSQITILGHQPFRGGFIGVDIFFVISGYLITSIILKELVTTGSFSFKHFYERRARRILPALLFVMLVSLPFAWMYLLPSSFIDFSKSILYSLGFSSNFYFHYSGQIYGAESGLLKPFLHTWSLSVEEQYYILFPIILLITFKYFRKYLIHILILGFAISLGLADWTSRNYPSASFYFLHTRIWELLAGSILAYLEIKLGRHGHRSKNQKLISILPFIGLTLIGYSILFFNDRMFHPSFYTLSPIIGVCLIIWFSNKNEIITKILSTKLFVGVGLISYSLYLWHYPIFAFDRIIEFTKGSLFNKLLLGLIILITSIFSYFFIERPARNKKNKLKFIISLISISISILVIVNINIVQKDVYKDKYSQVLISSIDVVQRWNQLNKNNIECINNKKPCNFFDKKNKKIILFGDSHIGSLSFDFFKKLENKNYNLITIIRNCFNYPDINFINRFTNKEHKICNKKSVLDDKRFFKDIKNSIVIIGGRFPVHLSGLFFDNQEGHIEKGGREENKSDFPRNKKEVENSLKNFVFNLIKNQNIVIIVYPIPEVGFSVPNEIMKKYRNFRNSKIEYLTTSYQVYKERTEDSFNLLDSLIDKNIYRVYPHTLFCDTTIKDRCVTHDDKNIFYVDDDHPSSKGAEMINDLIMKEIEKIELKSN